MNESTPKFHMKDPKQAFNDHCEQREMDTASSDVQRSEKLFELAVSLVNTRLQEMDEDNK